MDDFNKLVAKAHKNECRILAIFDPLEIGEEWAVKYYPDKDDDAHFYAYHSELDAAAHLILDELRGFNS